MLNFDSYAAGRTMADIGLDKDAREKGPRPCQPTRSFLVAMICLRPTADSPLVGVGVICFFLKRMFLLRPPQSRPATGFRSSSAVFGCGYSLATLKSRDMASPCRGEKSIVDA